MILKTKLKFLLYEILPTCVFDVLSLKSLLYNNDIPAGKYR